MDNLGQVCQRCKRFEVDLTNASDDLDATDNELRASRQIINLLQRQLELIRVEKEGLEKLIISQPDKSVQVDEKNYPSNISSVQQLVQSFDSLKSSDQDPNKTDTNQTQHELLRLIQTQLYAKDEEIVKLTFNLKEAQNDKEQLNIQLHLLEEDNAKLKSENSVLAENIALRDQTIVSLSNEVFEQGNPSEYSSSSVRRQSSVAESNQHSLLKAQRHIAKLIDTLDAYKKTNELLSKNVMQLTERCTQAEKKEIETRSQCHELEAKCCQIQSKLLSLLKEIEQSSNQQAENGDGSSCDGKNQEFIRSESVKLLIERLLEDKSLDIPLSWKPGNIKTKKSISEVSSNNYNKCECDELGFYIVSEEEHENKQIISDPSLKKHINSNRIHSQDEKQSLDTVDEAAEYDEAHDNKRPPKMVATRLLSVDATKGDEARWHMRWDNFIKDFDKIDLEKSKDFKNLLRSGVPQEYRCKVWKSLVDLRVGKERQSFGPDYYQSLLEPNRPPSSSKTSSSNSTKQIELDLLRTLPKNKHFEDLDSSGTVRLRRVLTAYAEHNPKVGYCQGMNRLAAVALLVLPEEEAFYCVVAIIDNIMPKGYYNDLWLAQVDSKVVLDYVAAKMPNLSRHFKQYGIEDISLFAWFLTIFVDGTPPALFLRIWDSFLFEGEKILFRVALALLKMCETELLHLTNSVAINNYIRSTINASMDIDSLFDIAFGWVNPLSSKSLRIRRQHNFEIMRSGFESTARAFSTPPPTDSDDDRDRKCGSDDEVEESSIISI